MPTPPITPQNAISPTSANPDPTAKIESDQQPNSKQSSETLLHRLGIPTSLEEAKTFGPKHYLIKIVSVVLLVEGSRGLYESLTDIFFELPRLPEIYAQFNYSESVYNNILYHTVMLAAANFLEALVGLSLAIKSSSVVKNFHIIAGIALFLISLYLDQTFPDLDQLSNPGLALFLQNPEF